MLSYLAAIAAAAATAALWYILHYIYIPKQLSTEPPLLPSRIPYIGHIIGLLRYGTRYFEITRSRLPQTNSYSAFSKVH